MCETIESVAEACSVAKESIPSSTSVGDTCTAGASAEQCPSDKCTSSPSTSQQGISAINAEAVAARIAEIGSKVNKLKGSSVERETSPMSDASSEGLVEVKSKKEKKREDKSTGKCSSVHKHVLEIFETFG